MPPVRRRQATLAVSADGRLALSRARPKGPVVAATVVLPPPDVFEYHVGFYTDEQARGLYRALVALPQWGLHTLRVYDRERQLHRLTATFALRPDRIKPYSASAPPPSPLSASPVVAQVLAAVQAWAGPAYAVNYVLLNYYRNGDDSVGLHGDHLGEMAGPVFSLSFQDTDDPAQLRFFDVVNVATGHKERLRIANGSLMVMHRAFHVLYRHGVPPQRGVAAGRVNVTCRCVHEQAP
jgi:alkylated DNA repair dioxygenase AlkB